MRHDLVNPKMLVLSRKLNEEILIGDNIRLKVIRLEGNVVKIGIEAPADVKIIRPDAIEKERKRDGRPTR